MHLTIMRMVSGFTTGILHYTGQSAIPLVILQTALLVYACVASPYQQLAHKIRLIVNESMGFMLVSCPLVLRYILELNTLQANTTTLTSWSVLAIMLVCFVINTAYLAKKMCKRHQHKLKQESDSKVMMV
jgi:hypothetical protein